MKNNSGIICETAIYLLWAASAVLLYFAVNNESWICGILAYAVFYSSETVVCKVVHMIKYPIISSTLPMNVLKVGDMITTSGGYVYQYCGFDTHCYADALMPDNSITCIFMQREDMLKKIESVSNSYGLKWKKTLD